MAFHSCYFQFSFSWQAQLRANNDNTVTVTETAHEQLTWNTDRDVVPECTLENPFRTETSKGTVDLKNSWLNTYLTLQLFHNIGLNSLHGIVGWWSGQG